MKSPLGEGGEAGASTLQVLQVPEVLQVLQVPEVLQVLQVPEVLQVLQVPEVLQVLQVPEVLQVLQVPEVLQVLQVPEVLQVLQVPEVLQVLQVPEVLQGPRRDESPATLETSIDLRGRAAFPQRKIQPAATADDIRTILAGIRSSRSANSSKEHAAGDHPRRARRRAARFHVEHRRPTGESVIATYIAVKLQHQMSNDPQMNQCAGDLKARMTAAREGRGRRARGWAV